jgi:hypothetical protein
MEIKKEYKMKITHSSELKTGDVIAFETHYNWKSPMSLLSLLIRKFAKLKYNHVGVIVLVWGIPMVYESL